MSYTSYTDIWIYLYSFIYRMRYQQFISYFSFQRKYTDTQMWCGVREDYDYVKMMKKWQKDQIVIEK